MGNKGILATLLNKIHKSICKSCVKFLKTNEIEKEIYKENNTKESIQLEFDFGE